MKHGFINVKAYSPDLRVADVKFNTAKIIQAIWDANAEGAKILVLPELCISSASCGDLFSQPALLDACEQALGDILSATADKDIFTVIGAPLRHNSKIYNCAVAISGGKILGVVPKSTLPNHSSSYELRYFCEPDGSETEIFVLDSLYPFGCDLIFTCTAMPELKIGIELGDDLYAHSSPDISLTANGATVIACPSAQLELVGSDSYKELICKAKSSTLICSYIIANACEDESTTDSITCAHNIICENGEILTQGKPFSSKNGEISTQIDVQSLLTARVRNNTYVTSGDARYIPFTLKNEKTALTRRVDKYPFIADGNAEGKMRYEKILTMQSHALARRLVSAHSKTAVIGISGGLDSTLALLVAERAFKYLERPLCDIHCITMPCFGTTERTKSNAVRLCELMGVTLKEINISDAVRVHLSDIGHSENDRSVAYENAQARERTQILMDYANDVGGLVVGTGDLSEIALGWCTYNADHMSMYNPNCDIPKTLVRALVDYSALCAEGEIKNILYDILGTPVSPELLPPDESGKIAQKTEDIVGPYELHDFFLYNFIRRGLPPSKIYRLAKYAFEGDFSAEEIYKWLETFIKRFFTQQFKRSCSVDGVKVGTVALSPRGDLKMPSDATYWVWLDELNSNKDY